MEWHKTMSGFWAHPKVADLSDKQHRTLTSSWGYAAQYETGGFINRTALRLIGGTPAVATALVNAGLWHVDGDGWRIHDWDDHQAGAIAHEDRKARDRARKQRARTTGHTTKASPDNTPPTSAENPRTVNGTSAERPRMLSEESPPTEVEVEEKREENTNPLRTERDRERAHAFSAAGGFR